MGLSCSCEFDYEYEFEAGEWYYDYDSQGYLIPLETSRRKRCCSCNALIDVGATCNKYPRLRYPYTDAEARIKCGFDDLESSLSEEARIPMAPHYHCERCAEIWLNLTDIGYECISPSENMVELLKEYHKLSGFKANQSLEMDGQKDARHSAKPLSQEGLV